MTSRCARRSFSSNPSSRLLPGAPRGRADPVSSGAGVVGTKARFARWASGGVDPQRDDTFLDDPDVHTEAFPMLGHQVDISMQIFGAVSEYNVNA